MLSIIWFLSIYQVLKIDWKSEMELVVPSRNVLYIKTLGWLCALGRSSWCTLLAPLISNIARHVNLISDYYQNKVTRKGDILRILIPMNFFNAWVFYRELTVDFSYLKFMKFLNKLWVMNQNYDFEKDRYGLTLILELTFILPRRLNAEIRG